MAGQRMTHPQQSLSRKVTALSDFEYRVWEQTKLSADDFGVLPFSPLPLRADNHRLRKATERQVGDALARLVADRLLVEFEHQGEAYLCAPAWQTWQMVAFPRKTVRPKPTGDAFEACDDATRYLFTIHPGGVRLPKPKTGIVREDFGSTSEVLPKNFEPSRAETPANAHANAHDPVVVLSEGGAGETAPPAVVVGRIGVSDRYRAIHGDTPADFDRKHGKHALRGYLCNQFVCLPESVFEDWLARLTNAGTTREQATADVLAWALDVKARYGGKVPGDDNFAFWRNEWARTHGSNRPSSAPKPGAGLDALIGGGRG